MLATVQEFSKFDADTVDKDVKWKGWEVVWIAGDA